jgi:hypothetical protein
VGERRIESAVRKSSSHILLPSTCPHKYLPALPDCIPYYGHGHPSADAGWGIAAWTITDWFSDYYADDVFDVAWYPNMKWYMTNWIKTANNTPDGESREIRYERRGSGRD